MSAATTRWALPLVLAAAFLLGGSSQGILSNLALQIAGVALLTVSVWQWRSVEARSGLLPMLATAAGFVLLLLLQLIPLPSAVWSMLPGRADIAATDALMGLGPVWRPISLSPPDTLATLLPMLLPLGIAAWIVGSKAKTGRRVTAALLAGGAIGLLVAIAQIASGGAERWYVYERSNVGVATGLFANSNHFAVFLLAALPFAGAILEERLPNLVERRDRLPWLLLFAVVVLSVTLGVILARSLFGILMLVPVVIASLVAALRKARRSSAKKSGPVLLAVGAIGLATILAAGALSAKASRDASTSISTRATMAEHSFDLIDRFGVVGSGLGTFAKVYPASERSEEIDFTFVNHAHNELLELLVEGGLAAFGLLALFLYGWWRAFRAMFRDPKADGYAIAGAMVSGLLLLHSLFDFPLRSPALSALFSASVALMLTSRRVGKPSKDLRPTRHVTIV